LKTNRHYLDVGSHPEYATAECDSMLQLIAQDEAGKIIDQELSDMAELRLREEGVEGDIYLFRNNTDSVGNSYGCHENYLVDRVGDFVALTEQFIPFLVSRQLVTGAGKVLPQPEGATFCLSQRADHMWEGLASSTTRSRPIINTRDEPHCDPTKYRRLHVIAGDANMSEVATLLKLGTTSIVLAMIEDDEYPEHLVIQDPVRAIRKVSHDPTLSACVLMNDGRMLTALQIQFEILDAAKKYASRFGLESVDTEVGENVLLRWESVLNGLDTSPLSVAHIVDWVAKKRIVDGFSQRHGIEGNDVRLKAIDLQYHDMRIDKCLALRSGLEELCTKNHVQSAMVQPDRKSVV
jgi:proteasome accessory factor A